MNEKQLNRLDQVMDYFQKMETLFRELEGKMYQKTAKLLFGGWHTFSKEDLLVEWNKVDSIGGQIKDLLERADADGSMSGKLKSYYNKRRKEILELAMNIAENIKNRPPTFWESLYQDFASFIWRLSQKLAYYGPKFLDFIRGKILKLLPAPKKSE